MSTRGTIIALSGAKGVYTSALSVVLSELLRWKRAEAWLVFLAAALPQTFMWYSALVLLVIAGSYKEALTLSFVASLGFGIVAQHRWELSAGVSWAVYVLSTFVPAIIVILKRPNKFVGIASPRVITNVGTST